MDLDHNNEDQIDELKADHSGGSGVKGAKRKRVLNQQEVLLQQLVTRLKKTTILMKKSSLKLLLPRLE